MPCSSSTAEADPWVPLKVSWEVPRLDGALYVNLTGTGGGLVELRVDGASGALFELVVVDELPTVRRDLPVALPEDSGQAAEVDRDIWEWKVTPDYREVAKRTLDRSAELGISHHAGLTTVWLGAAEPARLLRAAAVRVGVAASGELVCVSTPTPEVVDPGFNRL
ncbi:hypothetical protein SAMN05421541_106165 [Actinoplanes philippinensis]|uniref:Uncharacterized protein n=1 Tax=Actinoplanes philippinensis TaxID=35752 RepID=A0A1I2G450_9ACTN|nr:hypothetical protein SAMN05421541_106165 [Actinoplanes philippinensis]